jgi:hypothetical protein
MSVTYTAELPVREATVDLLRNNHTNRETVTLVPYRRTSSW